MAPSRRYYMVPVLGIGNTRHTEESKGFIETEAIDGSEVTGFTVSGVSAISILHGPLKD